MPASAAPPDRASDWSPPDAAGFLILPPPCLPELDLEGHLVRCLLTLGFGRQRICLPNSLKGESYANRRQETITTQMRCQEAMVEAGAT